jgi:hypothetical protein
MGKLILIKKIAWKINIMTFLSIILLLFTFFFNLSLMSQTSVIIPTGNTTSGSVNDPLGTYYGYERTSLIYNNSEIGTTGTISRIGFYLNSVSTPGNAVNVRVYMKMRTTAMTASTIYTNELSGATLVFGPTTIPSSSFVANQWVFIDLATPFNYTGDNLQILIETNATVTGNEVFTAKQFRYTTNATNALYQNWNQDNSAPTGNGTRSQSRPNIQLVFSNPFVFHDKAADPCLQTSFNHISTSSLTPYFTISSNSAYSNVQIELNTKSDFTGTSYI